MAGAITGESRRLEYPVIVAGETICTIKSYPESALFERDMARLIQAISGLGKMRNIGIDITDLPKEPAPPEDGALQEVIDAYEQELDAYRDSFMDVLDIAAPHFSNAADAIDALIAAGDKIAGKGCTEAILYNDNESFELFNAAFAPIFAEYSKKRGAKTNKYRAKLK